ncbi:MAG: hypothetical protein KDJ88_13875 [Bauldia sp.]|nr:hypothetical protein [Bauldia sp.]
MPIRQHAEVRRRARALASLTGALCLFAAPLAAADETLPAYLAVAVGKGAPASKADVAAANVMALDDGMQQIYGLSLEKYKANIRAETPVIIARFDDFGGSMTLYPPGKDPIHAEPVPQIYTLVKSVSHSTMAMYQLVAPYLRDPGDTSWRAPMAVYLARIKSAQATLGDLDLPDNVRKRLDGMLARDIAFMEKCLETGTFTFADLDAFARSVEPDIVKNVALAASTQVDHWESVLTGWQKMLGPEWDKTYAITNTLYVTRQNNILFTVLAQFMGKEAIDDRLILVGTTAFTTTEDTLFDVLARIIADRPLGDVFFRNFYLMDAELIGSAAQQAVEVDAAKQGKKALLPTLAPFDTHEWPWPADPASGPGPADMQEIPGD